MHRIHPTVGFIALGILAIVAFPALCAEKADTAAKPERLILMAPEYPGVIAAQGKEVSMDLTFVNKGRTDETLDVRVAQTPDGWKTRIKTYRYAVTGVHVPADDKKSLTFEAVPDKQLPPGDYTFLVEAQTRDGRFKMAQQINITLAPEQEASDKDQGVKLTTSYPVIRGPSDAAFEFSVEVDSRLDREAIFDLFAQGPKGWDINFKPAYETKYISSIRLKANQSQTIAVEVKPAPNSPAGEYPISLRVSSGEAKTEANLTVTLTGTYALDAGTSSGLLSLEARQGTSANVSFFVKNTGSAVNHDIKFMTFKPENWKIEFKPERIDQIEPNALKQVEMIITPYEEALVGDYSVGVKVEGEKASKTLEFRTSVKASGAWGWIGIGIIMAVVAGLFGLFRMLGRR
ncbi:MAG: NEW3 domain-containing protein [Desulfobacterales bacterium]|jgi:uncharacterized membrane protein|nr:NEW3 domain-containing protein [Desulfobacterales bacterium]